MWFGKLNIFEELIMKKGSIRLEWIRAEKLELTKSFLTISFRAKLSERL